MRLGPGHLLIVSGALSTVSSGLNSLAAVFLTDFLQLGCQLDLSEQRKTLITKLISCLFGLVSLSFVFLVGNLPGVLAAAIGIFGMVGGPILGVFSLGMFVPFSSSVGALLGLLSSLTLVFWAGFGQTVARQEGTYDSERFSPVMRSSTDQCPPGWTNITTPSLQSNNTSFAHLPLYDVSYLWYGPVSTSLCLLVGSLVSLIKPQDVRILDPRLISPNTITFFCWTPRFIRRKIREYLLSVGSEARENVSRDEVFGKNGSVNINLAFVPSDQLPSTQM